MKHSRIITLVIGAALVLPSFTFIKADDDESSDDNEGVKIELRAEIEKKRDERMGAIEEKRAELEKKREERKEEIEKKAEEKKLEIEKRSEERKAKIETKLKENTVKNVERIIGKSKERLGNTIERLDKLVLKIDSRIGKLTANGVDTTASVTLLEKARTELDTAKIAVAGINVDDIIYADVPKETLVQVKAEIETAKTAVKNAHKAMIDAIESLKANTKIQEDEDKDEVKEEVTN